MRTDLTTLRDRISSVVRGSTVERHVDDIVLEADHDREGSDFLRVILKTNKLEDVGDSELEQLIEAIENAVLMIDERYPSVRFADAA